MDKIKKEKLIQCVVCGKKVTKFWARKRQRTNENLCNNCYDCETFIATTY